MKGSILFNPDINIEVDVDPAAEEGARLISAKNLVDGQELGIGGGGDYDGYDFVISQVDSGTPVLEKGVWQDVYDALQDMNPVKGLYLKNTTPGEYHDTVSMVIPLTYVDYYSSMDVIQATGIYYRNTAKGVEIDWLSDDTITVVLP